MVRLLPWPWARKNRSILGNAKQETDSLLYELCIFCLLFVHHIIQFIADTNFISFRPWAGMKMKMLSAAHYSATAPIHRAPIFVLVSDVQHSMLFMPSMFTQKTLFHCVTSWRHHMHILSLLNTLLSLQICCNIIVLHFSAFLLNIYWTKSSSSFCYPNASAIHCHRHCGSPNSPLHFRCTIAHKICHLGNFAFYSGII